MSAFYAVTAASASTLVGLLFVAVQIGPPLVAAGPVGRRHAIARSTFTIFAFIFALSLFLMLPTPSPQERALVVIAASGAGAVRAVLTWLPVWRDKIKRRTEFRLLQTAWLLIGPLLTYLYLAVGGIAQLRAASPTVLDPNASGGFILLFVIALRNSWNLLVEARQD